MAHSAFSLIQAVKREQPYDEPAWRSIIGELLNDLQPILGEFELDPNPLIDTNAPSFVQWIWSKPCADVTPTATIWSAVVAGNLAEKQPGQVSFSVVVTLFLFSLTDKKRLCTLDGKSFIRLSLDGKNWKKHGWCEDHWGEWKDFVFPDNAYLGPPGSVRRLRTNE